MKKISVYHFLNYFFCAVWLINGLFCKVLNWEPRHQEIVGRILNLENPRFFTILIGLSEMIMAVWIVSRFKSKLNAIAQIFIIGLMNILEFILVPDLLLWGKLNIIFAFLFVLCIYYNEFILKKQIENAVVS